MAKNDQCNALARVTVCGVGDFGIQVVGKGGGRSVSKEQFDRCHGTPNPCIKLQNAAGSW